MMRVILAHKITPIKGEKEEQHDRAGLYTVKDAGGMTDWALKWHMCEAGPIYCAECELCAYGKEYIRRMKNVDIEGITRIQFSKKYGANSADVAFSVGRIKPIGIAKTGGGGHPTYLYNEHKAAHSLAGLWRGRAAHYRELAQQWDDKALAAERKAAGL